jgi:hypothetical protein
VVSAQYRYVEIIELTLLNSKLIYHRVTAFFLIGGLRALLELLNPLTFIVFSDGTGNSWIPMWISVGIAIAAAVVTFFLPETLKLENESHSQLSHLPDESNIVPDETVPESSPRVYTLVSLPSLSWRKIDILPRDFRFGLLLPAFFITNLPFTPIVQKFLEFAGEHTWTVGKVSLGQTISRTCNSMANKWHRFNSSSTLIRARKSWFSLSFSR